MAFGWIDSISKTEYTCIIINTTLKDFLFLIWNSVKKIKLNEWVNNVPKNSAVTLFYASKIIVYNDFL